MQRTIAHIDIEIHIHANINAHVQYMYADNIFNIFNTQYTISNQYQYLYDRCVHVLDLYIYCENLWMYLYYILQQV